MTQERFIPTPRDRRVKILESMTKASLVFRAKSLGNVFGAEHSTKDELISMILEIEQEKGLVAR